VIGINSFGFGGANGHAIIEEYIPTEQPLYNQPANIDALKYHYLISIPSIHDI
jgi:acyl transferase domain-containing protein